MQNSIQHPVDALRTDISRSQTHTCLNKPVESTSPTQHPKIGGLHRRRRRCVGELASNRDVIILIWSGRRACILCDVQVNGFVVSVESRRGALAFTRIRHKPPSPLCHPPSPSTPPANTPHHQWRAGWRRAGAGQAPEPKCVTAVQRQRHQRELCRSRQPRQMRQKHRERASVSAAAHQRRQRRRRPG